MQDMVLAGHARPVLPTTESGYKLYSSIYGGRLFSPPVTNYQTNPRLKDSNGDGFPDVSSTAFANATLSGSVVPLGDGSYIHRVTLTGLAGVASVLSFLLGGASSSAGTFTTADSIAAQVVARVESASGCGLRLYITSRDSGDYAINGTQQIVTGGAFQRWSAVHNCSADAGTSRACIYLQVYDFHEGDSITFEFYHPMMAKSSVVGPYFDGSTPGCSWAGTVDASISALAVSILRYTTGLPGLGTQLHAATLACNFTPIFPSVASFMYHQPVYLSMVPGLSSYMTLRTGGASTAGCQRQDSLAGDKWSMRTPVSWAANQTLKWVGRFDDTTLDFAMDGVNASQTAHTLQAEQLLWLTMTGTVGLMGGGGWYLGNVLYSPTRKSAAWTAAFASAPNDPMLLFREFVAVGDLFVPLHSDSVGYVKTA